MTAPAHERIRNSPYFRALTSGRNRFAVRLSSILLTLYFGYMALAAFAGDVLAKPVWNGSGLTLGIALALGMLLLAFILTGLYVRYANRHFDPLINKLLDEAK